MNRILEISTHERTSKNEYKLEKFSVNKEIGKHWYGKRIVDE